MSEKYYNGVLITKLPEGYSKSLSKKVTRQQKAIDKTIKEQTDVERSREFLFPKYTSEELYAPGVYLIEFPDTVKIGVSYKIRNRVQDYKRPYIKPIRSITIFYCDSNQAACNLESIILKTFNAEFECTPLTTSRGIQDIIQEITKLEPKPVTSKYKYLAR